MKDLAPQLEALKARYDTDAALEKDPLSLVLRHPSPMDQEAVAWVAAHLAYGRVAPMLRAIGQVLDLLGPSPAEHLRAADPRMWQTGLANWKWRFHTGQDMVHWLAAWKRLDAESGHLGLAPHLRPEPGEELDLRLSRLVQRLRKELPPSPGLRFSLPDPMEGSACKRWRMFLRWMIRSRWPDPGCWSGFSPSQLVIPLDTHVARVSRLIGLTTRRTPDGRMAQEITRALRRLAPQDPLTYDFALSHLGILGECPGRKMEDPCPRCPLVTVCQAGKER